MTLRVVSRLTTLVLAGGLIACQPTTAVVPTSPAIGAAVDAEACEHLTEGPAVALTAAVTAGSAAPQANAGHHRFDVALTPVEGKHRGSVRLQSGKAGDYVIYVNDAIPVDVQDANLVSTGTKQSANNVTNCPAVKGRHVVALGVGTYYVTFGPTDKTKVGFVIEAADGRSA